MAHVHPHEDPHRTAPPPPPSPSPPTISLPRTLERPVLPLNPGPRATLDAIDPGLAEFPLPFIRTQLVLCAEQLLRGLHDVSVQLPAALDRDAAAPLPRSLSVSIPRDGNDDDDESLYPTHVFAASGSSACASAPATEAVTLIPIHGAVFATNCIAPILQPVPVPPDILLSDSEAHSPGTHRLVLPLVPIALPSIPAFLALRAFMYTHRDDALLAELLPPLSFTQEDIRAARGASAEGAEARLGLAGALVDAYPRKRDLLDCAGRVHEVWRTACALGMDDDALWDAIGLAWEVVVVALNLAARRAESLDIEGVYRC